MSAVVSKNLYELLGNDHDEDSDKEPEPPVKVIDKTPARSTKRNAPAEAPASKAGTAPVGGPRRGGATGNELAFRDRQAGSSNNRAKPTEEGGKDRQPRGENTYGGGGRGGRDSRGGARNLDRHSRGVGGESEKQVAHGWGANEGGAELADEQAGEAIASAEVKEALTGDGGATVEPAAEAEPEDNSISYADYLIQQEEKRKALGAGVPEARKANEGSKQDKKWESAKAITKEEEEDFVAASAGKAKRERERKTKQTIDIDQRFVEAPEHGRGGGRGGRGRGRGDFQRRDDQGRGGGGRGGRGPRGGAENRQGPGPRGPSSTINTSDTSAFPSLGS